SRRIGRRRSTASAPTTTPQPYPYGARPFRTCARSTRTMASTRLDPYALEDPTAAPALDAAEPSPSRIRVARGALERVLGSPLAVVTVAVAAAVSATIWSATTHSM